METPVTEQQQLRAALDAALVATTDFGIRKLKDPRWQPAPDSEASAELASRQIRQDGQPWSEDVLRTPYALASLLMTGVLDNLGSIRQLISDPMPAIGPTVIARSAMEIGATAWWLMQPGIGARRRTCRQLALSLVSARRAAQVAEELRDDESREEGLAQEDRVLAQIASLAISPPEGPRYRPVIEGESFPEATEITASAVRLNPGISAAQTRLCCSRMPAPSVRLSLDSTASVRRSTPHDPPDCGEEDSSAAKDGFHR